jgi:HEAT repeat protein
MNKTKSLRSLLSGGDRRSIAQSNRALALVRSNPELVAQLAALARDADWLLSMRAMDLLEKLAHEHPEWVEPFKALFIGPLADSDKWEVRLQVVRALPLFAWSPEENRRAIEILLRDAEHPQTFVRAWAVDSLACFAEKNGDLMPKLRRYLRELEESGSKASVTRARKIRSRLESHGDSRTS